MSLASFPNNRLVQRTKFPNIRPRSPNKALTISSSFSNINVLDICSKVKSGSKCPIWYGDISVGDRSRHIILRGFSFYCLSGIPTATKHTLVSYQAHTLYLPSLAGLSLVSTNTVEAVASSYSKFSGHQQRWRASVGWAAVRGGCATLPLSRPMWQHHQHKHSSPRLCLGHTLMMLLHCKLRRTLLSAGEFSSHRRGI